MTTSIVLFGCVSKLGSNLHISASTVNDAILTKKDHYKLELKLHKKPAILQVLTLMTGKFMKNLIAISSKMFKNLLLIEMNSTCN